MTPLYLTVWYIACLVLQTNPITVQPDYEALVAAERAFARQAKADGIRRAFLDNLDEQSVVFVNQKFVAGRPIYAQQSNGSGLLSWRPAYAEISVSGEFGYTTGPFEFRRQAEDAEPVAFGQYTSVWHKTNAGQWKVLIDFGCEHGKPSQLEIAFQLPDRFGPKQTEALDTAKANRELLSAESAFNRAARQSGLSYAYRLILPLNDSVRILQAGHYPLAGRAARAMEETQTQIADFQALCALTSRAGDLGYTYGFAIFGEKRRGYLRIWRKRKGDWQLAQEVLAAAN